MSRPRIDPNNKRSCTIGTTLTPTEHADLVTVMERYKVTPSNFIREALTFYTKALKDFHNTKE